ncbi:MAG: alpha/beta hydrolase, partial [Bacilli bacterium]|nr:alpha/beta hydrolase [Bacilli bacterium]
YGLLDFSKTFTDFFTEESEKEANKNGFKTIKSNRLGITFRLGKNLYQDIKNQIPYRNLLDLEIPILFVHGKMDSIIPYQSSKEVKEQCKNGTLKLIENESHAFRKSKEGLEEAINSTVEFIKA